MALAPSGCYLGTFADQSLVVRAGKKSEIATRKGRPGLPVRRNDRIRNFNSQHPIK
jgi:hypothetical protein